MDQNPASSTAETHEGLVVGVGASAGGLEALREFLRHLPADPGLALVLVQHADEGDGALLQGALQTLSPFPVLTIEPGLRLRPNTLHVAPPGRIVGLKNDLLQLRPPRNQGERRSPIDRLFHALAAGAGPRAVGIILSGLGSDGALGLAAVGAAGGMTMAQASETALAADMPSSVAGVADHVLAPADLARTLGTYAGHWRQITEGSAVRDRRREIQARLTEICDVMRRRTGHDFKHYKTSTLVRRLERRMQVCGIDDVDAYVGHLARDLQEPHTLFRELLIGVTSFFREPEAFGALNDRVIAPLLAQRSAQETVRIWVPGCATGEEAYSIAILAREAMADQENAPKIQIFATDVNERSLAVARRGSYPQGIAAQVSGERLDRFFLKRGRRFQVRDEIREMCLFSAHNLIGDPPFSRLDLISCRNLLIYLGSHLQKKLIPVFHYALRSGGFLFLGASESLTGHGELFRTIDAKHRIAQRKDTPIHVPGTLREIGSTGGAGWRLAGPPTEGDLGAVAQRILLDEFAPKYAIVTEDGQVVFLSEGAEIFIQPPAGAFSNNIMRMVRRGLSVGLRAAFNQAVAIRRTVVRDIPAVHTAEGLTAVRLTVQPMPDLGREDGLYMLVFQENGTPNRRSDEAGAHPDADAVIEGLERELMRTREDLERTVQDLEAANEELKSSNEELLSMNEELQSANEELETSKEEVQAANQALAAANADLENLLRSTRIATIFLDRNGDIRSFTPAASEIYNIAASDVGRPLAHFTHRLRTTVPLPGEDEIRASAEPVDHELVAEDGRWYLRRVLPYRTPDGVADGLVITFTDVTGQKRSEAALRDSEQKLRVALEAARLGAWERDLRTGELTTTPTCRVNFGLPPDHPLTVDELQSMRHPEDAERVDAAIRDAVENNRDYDVEYRVMRPDGGIGSIIARGHAIYDESGAPIRIVGVTLDVTERVAAKKALEDLERRQSFLLALNDRIRGIEDPFAIMEIATESLGRHLRLGRVGYGEVDAGQTHVSVARDWTDPPMPSVAGEYRMQDFGRPVIADLKAGRTIAVGDIRLDPRTSGPAELGAYGAIGTKAVLAVPLVKDDALTAMLFVHHPEPRPFAAEEIGLAEDVAERTWAAVELARTEAALRESEARFRAMADSAPMMIWVNGPDGGCEFVNQAYLDFFGKTLEEVVGFGWAPSGHPDDGSRYVDAYMAALAARAPFRAEARFRRADGEYRWLRSEGLPRFNTRTGAFQGYVGSSLDVTESKEAEAALRESEERLQLSQEAGGVGLWDWNLNTGEVFWSPMLRDLLGVPGDLHATAESWGGLIHPDDQSTARDAADAAIARDERLDTEFRIIRPADGAILWLASRGEVFRDEAGRPCRLVGVNFDITDRKAAEAALWEGSERLQLALRAADMGDWRWDAATDLVTMSERGAEIFGILAGPHMTWSEMQDLLLPADARRAAEAVEQAVRTRSPYSVEYRIRRPDGRQVWISAKGQPTFAPDGRPSGMTGVVHDITERKHAQERQHLLIRELHHRVKNTLATVQAIVSSTARTASSIDEFYQGFVGRIVSLAHTHNLLTEDDWQKAPLDDLLRSELGPYDDGMGRRVHLEGPPVELPSDAAVPIGMAVHELTTNAAKHGALSRPGGRVNVTWTVETSGEAPVLEFTWIERGGPPVETPTRQGFGSRLLQRVLATQLQAEVRMDYDREGARFFMRVPLPKPSGVLNSLI